MENILPPERRLGRLVEDNVFTLLDMLKEHYECHNTFVDDSFEIDNPLYYDYFELMAGLLSGREEVTKEDFMAVQEGFHFARSAYTPLRVDFFASGSLEYIAEVLRNRLSNEDASEKILQDAQGYLNDNLYVSHLIADGLELKDMELTDRQYLMADTVAALTFRQIEEMELKAYVTYVKQEADITQFMKDIDNYSQSGE